MVFLSNYLVFKIVLAALGRVDYPVAGDLELKYDTANKIYLSGGSLDYVDDYTLHTTIGGETTSHEFGLGIILNKTTTTAYEVALPSNSVHATFGINQYATRYVHQYPVADGYQNGKFQVYSGTPSGGYTTYGSPITPFDGNEVMLCSMSADGKYILVTNYNGGFADGYKMYKDNGSEYVYHSSYACIGSSTNNDTGYTPAFVPSNNNFVITGTGGGSNSGDFYFKLYIYDPLTETWTGKTTVYSLNAPTGDAQRGLFGKSFTYDGKYLMMSDNGTPTRGEVYEVDWDANTMVNVWYTTEGSNGDGAGGAISPDNRYVVLCRHDGNPYRVYENTSGDWSTVVNVTSEFDLTGSGTSTVFGSFGVNFSGYSSKNKTPLYIGQAAGLYGDGKFRLENWSKRSLYQIYITDASKYSVDATIAGLKYKTNELDITSLTIPAKVVQVSAGGYGQSMALTQDGFVYAWGEDTYGQMGQGTTDTNVNTPVKVKGVGGSGFLSNITKITVGGSHCMALASDGTLYAWGDNTEGQIGDASTTERKTPVEVSYSGDPISNISAGLFHSALTTTTGKVYCWGQSNAGQIGDGTSGTDRTSPVQVVGVGGSGTLTGIRDVSCGDSFTHAIKESDGTLYGWGKNYYGAVGNGAGATASGESNPVVAIFQTDSSTVTGITQISSGGDYAMFLKSDGTVYGAGYNLYGQIGNATSSDAHDGLVQVSGVGGSSNLTGITQIATCLETSLALKSDGTMYSWGRNNKGQNGLGTVGGTNPSTPVAITLLTGVNTIAGDTSLHFIATKPDGSVFCWGQGSDGQIGDGTNTANQGTPTQVLAGAGPSVDGKFNLLTEPRLTFDGYNKLSLLHGLSSVSSKLFLGSNVYDIGTLTSDLTIETPGLYRGLVYDTSSNVAYFNKTTVGAIGSTMAGYEVEQIIPGYSTSSGNDSAIDFNGDGTRMVVGMGSYNSYDGRAAVYHLENGSWVQKVDIPNPATSINRFGSHVSMNNAGTRILINQWQQAGGSSTRSKTQIFDYTNNAWSTTPTASVTLASYRSGKGGMAANKDGTVFVTGTAAEGNIGRVDAHRYEGGSWNHTVVSNMIYPGGGIYRNPGECVALDGTGNRCLFGTLDSGGSSTLRKVFESNYDSSSGAWGTPTEVIGFTTGTIPLEIRMSENGTRAVILGADGYGGIYDRQSGTSWTESYSVNGLGGGNGQKTTASISYDGTMVLTSNREYDTSITNPGRAYLYQYSGGSWSLTKTYDNPKTTPVASDVFGISTALAKTTKDRFAIGMPGDDTYGSQYGSIYTYTNAIPDFISFDTYNKLSISSITPTSTTLKYFSNTYDIGTATNIYIESEGKYTAEMKGSSAFALDSNVVSGTISSIVSPLLHLDFESGGLVSTGLNTTQYKYGSSSLYRNDSSVTVSNDGSYNIGNTSSAKATIMLWVRPESYPSYSGDANRIVVAADGRSESSSSYKKWAIALRQHSSIDEVWQFHYPNSSNSNKKVSYTPSDIPVGAWYHVCVTIETGSLKFYIDGVDVTSSLTGNKSDIESAWAGFNDDEGFKFCKTDANYLKGWVDDFKLFNSVLTLSEITSHMNASKLSPPSMTFDGFNKYTFTNADTGSTYKLKYESNTYDLGTISNVYIANPGTYSAEIKGATNFALSSNITGSLGTSTNDVSPSATTISFYAGSWNGSYEYQLDTSQTTDSAIFYELYNIGGSAADNRHGLEFRKETDGSTKVYAETASNSLHPYTISINSNTPTASVTISGQVGQVLKGFNSSTLNFEFTITSDHLWTIPKLDFDGYNKLTFSGLESGSTSNVTFDGNTYSIGTASNVYIENTGTYEAESKGTTTFALTKKQVSSSPSDTPADSSTYNLKYTINRHPYLGYTYSRITELSIVDGLGTHTWSKTGSFFNTDGQEFEYMLIGENSSGTTTSASTTVALPYSVTTTVVTGTSVASDFTNRIWNGSASTTSANEQQSCTPVSADSPGTSILEGYIEIQGTYTSAITPAYLLVGFTSGYDSSDPGYGGAVKSVEVIVDGVTYFNIVPDQYTPYGIAGTLMKHLTTASNCSLFAIKLPNKIHVPKLKFNDYKLSINGITPTSTTLKYESNTYEIGTATNIYVENTGDYTAEIGNATDFALTNTTVSGTIKTIEPMLRAGFHNGHALTYDGKLYAWGRNTLGTGELGVGDASNRTVPTLCTGITQGQVEKFLDTDGNAPKTMTWIKTIDNKIYATGNADLNQIPGHTSDLNTFTDVTSHFGDQSLSSNNIIQVCFGGSACAGLTETGNVWTWGQNDNARGNLGNGGTTSSTQAVPAQITFSSATDNITKLANGHDFTIALDNAGDVWLWGSEWLGNTWGSVSPIKMGTALDSITITDIAASYSSMYAISNTGVLYASGEAGSGQIMDGSQTDVTSSSNPDWKEVTYFSSNLITVNKVYPGTQYAGGGFVDTSDGWYAFGVNGTGNLGLGDTANKLSPVKFTGVSNIKKFAVGYGTSHVVTEDGKYYAWGSGTDYARGDNNTDAISYPKYIDTLPNILAPSFDFDGYDKIYSNKNYLNKSGKITRVNASFELGGPAGGDNNAFLELTLDKDTDVRMTGAEVGNGMSQWVHFGGGNYATVLIGSDGYIYFDDGVGGLGWGTNSRGKWVIGEWMFLAGSGGPGSGSNYTRIRINSQIPVSGDGDTSIKYTKGTTTYDVGSSQIITVPDPGTYDAQLNKGDFFALKSTTVPATKASGLYTWAFHHGNFDNAYGDGDILTARENGRFYADTPAYTGDIGTITAVNPFGTTQPTLVSSLTITNGKALNTLSYSSYVYRSTDTTNTRYVYALGTLSENTKYDIAYNWVTKKWLDIDSDATHNTFGTSASDTTNTSRISTENPQTVYVMETYWNLLFAIFTNPYYQESISSTTYTFAPPSGGLTANVLMVAGGGGGGGRAAGGGGGAGGLVYTAGTSLAQGATKTIVVGNGDSGGYGEVAQNGYDGKDTTFTGLTPADGGGGGGNSTSGTGVAGGSGGGGGGSGSGGAAASGSQGTAGGSSSSASYGGGGGGAGAAGSDYSGDYAGDGGTGKFFGTGSSFTDFGDEYGEGGYFAGGGAGGSNGAAGKFGGTPGRGGGGYGGNYYGYMGVQDEKHGGSQHALPHTGSGGGGAGSVTRDQHPGYDTVGDGGVKGHGGRGGSGIVLIQTNVAPPNGANTAVVQVGNPRRRSLPPAVEDMGSEVNRFYIIDSQSMPTYKLPTHWYLDPPSYSGNHVYYSTQGTHSLQKRADGGTSNVWYATSAQYFADYGTKMAQSADAVFMPVEAERYSVLLSIGQNSTHDIQLEMAADGTAKLYEDNGSTHLASGTIKCFTVGKWHHIALTVDSEHNAVGYVNGHPVVSTTHTSHYDVGTRSGNMHMRVGVGSITFRKFLTYEVSTYNFHMSPKQVLQRAAEVGLGPKLEYDGLNTIKILNTEPGSTIRLFTSNVSDTSNVFIVADPAAGEYTVPESGKYYAEIKGTDTFTITKTLDVSGTLPLYQYPPLHTKYTWSNNTGDDTASDDTGTSNRKLFSVSGSGYGDGQYEAWQSVASITSSGNPSKITGLFTNAVNIAYPTIGGQQLSNWFKTTTLSNVDLSLQLPSAKTIRKYIIYPLDSNTVSPYTPGSSVNPILEGNSNEDRLRLPKSWIFKGSNNLSGSWTTIHTVTNKVPSIYGDIHTISSPGSYIYYRISISANNGSSEALTLGELQLWGDA